MFIGEKRNGNAGQLYKTGTSDKDKYIPLILGCVGIAVSGIYVFATCSCSTAQDIAMAVFTSVTQGILVAGLSTYVNQLIKQMEKDEWTVIIDNMAEKEKIV